VATVAFSATMFLALAGCTDAEAGQDAAGHSHAGGVLVSLPVGDGTRAEEVGYSLVDVGLPRRAGKAGQVRLRIDTFRGTAQTEFVTEQARNLHLYVVRDDLAVFRHLHPTMAADGTWTAPVTLPAPGKYRVIAEFVALDDGGGGDHLVLGSTGTVGGSDEGGVDPATDPFLEVEVTQAPTVGPDGRLRLMVRDAHGRPVSLGTYLGTSGHVTGFHEQSGAVIHLHPMAEPEVTEDGTELTFHSEVQRPGAYQLFVQVRVEGYLHTVPVNLTVR
jgi:hypothetical protein